ncbi:MAG: hypothetical protein WBP72_11585 [Rhodocyclaceae bacterium]|jgi:hypothetical protein
MQRSAWIAMTAGLLVSCAGYSQQPNGGTPLAEAPKLNGEAGGSTAFCLFEVSNGSSTPRRFINLGIVQYVELAPDEVRIYYGGGNFGSGHEVKIPVRSREQGQEVLARLNKAARGCR